MIWLPQIFEAMTGGGYLTGAAVRRTTDDGAHYQFRQLS
jgi:hypothetical protein